MKTNEKYGAYEAPRVEVIEVEVEKGFQASPYDFPMAMTHLQLTPKRYLL